MDLYKTTSWFPDNPGSMDLCLPIMKLGKQFPLRACREITTNVRASQTVCCYSFALRKDSRIPKHRLRYARRAPTGTHTFFSHRLLHTSPG